MQSVIQEGVLYFEYSDYHYPDSITMSLSGFCFEEETVIVFRQYQLMIR